ncbi:hypothetical protein MMPV_000141 [Pyropia vietnamensis]
MPPLLSPGGSCPPLTRGRLHPPPPTAVATAAAVSVLAFASAFAGGGGRRAASAAAWQVLRPLPAAVSVRAAAAAGRWGTAPPRRSRRCVGSVGVPLGEGGVRGMSMGALPLSGGGGDGRDGGGGGGGGGGMGVGDGGKQARPVGRQPLASAASPTAGKAAPGGGLPTPTATPTATLPTAAPVVRIRPKQSLGQNFLRDEVVAAKIVRSFVSAVREVAPPGDDEDVTAGVHVVEVGAGTGSLTRRLVDPFPRMTAVEIDGRAVAALRLALPGLRVVQADVLALDWVSSSASLAATTTTNKTPPATDKDDAAVGRRPLAVVGNLPYNIVSQILLALLETPADVVATAVVMVQKEVAERLVARPRCKAYGILSVVAQLYAVPTILFEVPPSAFYPVPDVQSAMVRLDMRNVPDGVDGVVHNRPAVRRVVRAAFQQRRKTLRNSLKGLTGGAPLGDRWASRRPEELTPSEFVELAAELYGEGGVAAAAMANQATATAAATAAPSPGRGISRRQRRLRTMPLTAIADGALDEANADGDGNGGHGESVSPAAPARVWRAVKGRPVDLWAPGVDHPAPADAEDKDGAIARDATAAARQLTV